MQRFSKKLLALLLVVFTIAAMAGCGKQNGSSDTDKSSGDKKYNIAMIANTTINDGGWNAACYAAMLEAAETYGFETTYTDEVAQTDYVSTLTNYATMGYTAVFAPGTEFTDAVSEVAANFPDTTFILLNGDLQTDNIISILADNYQLGEIAGCLAALQTQTKHVALVGGIEISTADESVEGFKYAINKINPDIDVSIIWADTFDDAAKGKEIADSLVSTKDVDVIYGLASVVDSGIRETLKDKENVWNIAQPSDMASTAPDIIVNSVCSSTGKMLSIALEMITKGEANALITGDVSNGCIFLGSYGDCANDSVKENMDSYMQAISDKTF